MKNVSFDVLPRCLTLLVIALVVTAAPAPSIAAEGQIVMGVRNSVLTVYTREGQKLKQVGERNPVTDTEVNGLVVREITPRRLVLIHLRKEDVYVRGSQLELSLEEIPICPESLPTQAMDETRLISPGLGAKCNSRP